MNNGILWILYMIVWVQIFIFEIWDFLYFHVLKSGYWFFLHDIRNSLCLTQDYLVARFPTQYMEFFVIIILISTCQFLYINMEFSVCHIWLCRQNSPMRKYACDFPVWIMEFSIFHIWKSTWIFFPTRNVEISIFHVTIWEKNSLYKKWKSLYFNALPSKPLVNLNDSKSF